MKKNHVLSYIAGAILLYGVSTAVSYAVFSFMKGGGLNPPPTPVADDNIVIDPNLPKTEICPINGAKYTTIERAIWEKRRPLAVMIENHLESRPQSGLSYADVVYETVAEGGITRFMGIFYCGIAAYNVGLAPVRSARTYFIDWVSEYDALYNHVGGAGKCNDDTVDPRAKALCQIQQYKIKDLDQFSIPFPICYRNYNRLDHPVATEHTMVCFSNKLYDLAAQRGWNNVDKEGVSWDENFDPWNFKEDEKSENRGTMVSISFVHWKGYEADYGVKWTYDRTTNVYKRFNGGQPHMDLETKQQLTAKNIVIQFAKEISGIDEHAHLLYGTIGSGQALIFQDGKVIEGNWKKTNRTARTKFYDKLGKEIVFNRGQIWIEVVANGTDIEY